LFPVVNLLKYVVTGWILFSIAALRHGHFAK